MKMIKGKNNRILLHVGNEVIDVLSKEGNKFEMVINDASISIDGNANVLSFTFDKEEDVVPFFQNKGLNIMVNGNENLAEFGKVGIGWMPDWGMNGLHLIIGNAGPRYVNHTTFRVGNNTFINGATIYLQDDDSHITIGNDCMISWGIDIWCTDAHTIFNEKSEATNQGRFIELGNHVWVGKDVKIGKNVRIADGCIIGWGSIVTRSCEVPHSMLVGIPAKAVKQGIDWNHMCISRI